MTDPLRRKHRNRTCFFTLTKIDVSEIEDMDDWHDVMYCNNPNMEMTCRKGDVVEITSRGPIRHPEYVPHSCECSKDSK